MGVSPTSSLGATAMTDQANARALASAGAINKERNDTKILGMSLRENAAKFGRNQTGTGIAALAALQGGTRRQGSWARSRRRGMPLVRGRGCWGRHGRDQLHGQYGPEPDADEQNSASQAGLGSLLGTE